MNISGIQPTTVLEAGQIWAAAVNKDWVRDRKEIVDYLNRFREDLYFMYDDFKLFTDKFYCMELQCYPVECIPLCNCGDGYYMGITIPHDIDGVMAMWEDHEPLRLYSKWWEARVGRITDDIPQTFNSSTLIHEEFPTQRCLLRTSGLHFIADHPDDEGKTITAVLDTAFSKNKEFKVQLSFDNVVAIDEPVTNIRSIVLPELLGKVTLSQDDGYELSEYCGYDKVPSYRRLKISLPCSPHTNLSYSSRTCEPRKVLIQGNQKFKPVYFDSDIVEVGSRRILETAARFYRYGENSTDTEQLRKAQLEEERLNKLLRGATNRKRGNSDQDPAQFTRRKRSIIASNDLAGYRARRGFRRDIYRTRKY